jgi:hypothetical protein
MSDNSEMSTNALSSASAGLVSRLMTHPLDTAKARIQASTTIQYKNTLDVLVRTTRNEGFLALYRGFGAVVLGGTPGTIVYLTGYDFFKKTFTSTPTRIEQGGATSRTSISSDSAIHFCSGMLAETLACIIYVPVDVIKERLQVQHSTTSESFRSSTNNYYSGSMDALKRILNTEGLRGIYKGYLATLASFGPFSAFYFAFYEKLKSLAQTSIMDDKQNMSLHQTLFCSSVAGAGASWITSPLDMAKLRLQVQRGQNAGMSTPSHSHPTQYKGMVDCLRHIYNEKGIQGLFRGAGARVAHFVPATTITMTCYEEFRIFYSNVFHR